MKKFKIALAFIILTVTNSCKKEETSTQGSLTQAMFWVDGDYACGNISVTCNGKTNSITGYHSSQPQCGESNTAIFDLPAGTYPFSASCGSKTWNGTVTVAKGKCNAFKLNSGGTSTGGGVTTPTTTLPSTLFISSQDYSVSKTGANWTEKFTLTTSGKLVFRFASQYKAQAAIISSDQLSNFQTNKSFTGYGVFDNQVGSNTVSLSAGTYYVAVRNTSTGENKWSLELDYPITLPSSDKASFIDTYINGAKTLTAGTKFWQPFTIQSGFRYFLDGCNVNSDVRIIAANQLASFQGNQTYQHYSDYYQADGAAPGLVELKLPAGEYYIISYNSIPGSLVYSMERWKVTN